MYDHIYLLWSLGCLFKYLRTKICNAGFYAYVIYTHKGESERLYLRNIYFKVEKFYFFFIYLCIPKKTSTTIISISNISLELRQLLHFKNI